MTSSAPYPATIPADYFSDPYIDVDEWRSDPQRRYVHGGFRRTETRFSFHLPHPDQYGGRFFQYIAPVPDSEHFSEGRTGEEDKAGFCIESGAIFIETNGGGPGAANTVSGLDPVVGAFGANAAAAQYARALAVEMYGEHRVYGYSFGGSGGGFRTIGGAENTTGVWDGFVPYVIGTPMSIPNCFTARLHAMRVLQHKLDDIVDAMEPGGSGDPYATLDDEEAAAFTEVTKMGFPPTSWFAYTTMGMHGLAALYPGVRAIDPGYFDDFWTVPGYLGADPTPSLLAARVQHATSLVEVLDLAAFRRTGVKAASLSGESTGGADDAWLGSSIGTPVAVRLASPPATDPQSSELLVTSGAAAGLRLVLLEVIDDLAILGPADPSVVSTLSRGDDVVVDNSGFLAIQTYHRHQVPGPDFPVWDQFRDADGIPLYPQRPLLIGPIFAGSVAGTIQRGEFSGRMIVVECLLDREAYPWQADWYRQKAAEYFGDDLDDHFRLWMVESAIHADSEEQEHPGHTVSYLGVLQQALRDLSAWVEDGLEPPANSVYEMVDGQVVVPRSAGERRGVQPTVELSADGSASAVVAVGQPVNLSMTAETPGVGSVVAVEWDEHGEGRFAPETVAPSHRVTTGRTVSYSEPGVYFPAVRVAATRTGSTNSPFARLQNLARVRITVTSSGSAL